jgi:hypothetical protein
MENERMSVYTDNGYDSRADYLRRLAAEHDYHLADVLALADVLGPSEDFDGLVTELEDYYTLDDFAGCVESGHSECSCCCAIGGKDQIGAACHDCGGRGMMEGRIG